MFLVCASFRETSFFRTSAAVMTEKRTQYDFKKIRTDSEEKNTSVGGETMR